jgi:hypothetical protein
MKPSPSFGKPLRRRFAHSSVKLIIHVDAAIRFNTQAKQPASIPQVARYCRHTAHTEGDIHHMD